MPVFNPPGPKGSGHPKGLFITDFDSTLLRSDASFAQRDLDALDSLTRCGIKTAVATGRSLYLHHPVPENHRYAYRRVNLENPDFESRFERYCAFGKLLNSVSRNSFGEAAQFLAVVPHYQTHDVLKQMRNGLPCLSIIRSTSPLDHVSIWIEFFHPGVSKGKTAAWLASELGVDPADTMAIGNDYNDLDLLEWATPSFAVENAPDEMKRKFRQVASNSNGGVAEAVNCWLDEN